MSLHEELELVIDKMVEEFNKLKKENEQLWSQLEALEKEKDELESKVRELELKIRTDNEVIGSLVERIRKNLSGQNFSQQEEKTE
ncbi:hypothetical protein [Kosmotoga sp. DU53]|uniref:hypothetical protein n=1 Tax=Kosmotoga sp. DU53 TaxID=1310160 RepID=UPI0007C5BF30|nr:hypothetical protein [Kosmotoga sp. DU53]OAA19150.1 hypothetical protein DU53_11045 [Kosmotoga sp. DU53]